MNRDEFTRWFDEQVGKRWPKWQVNGIVLGDWFSTFGGCEAELLTEAVRRHRVYDDPSSPSSSRLLELAAKMRAERNRQNKPKPEPVGEFVTGAQFWQMVPTIYSKQGRIELMKSMVKFHKTPWEKDPEAYQWAMEQGLVGKKDDRIQSTLLV